jgi:hypothetical protein
MQTETDTLIKRHLLPGTHVVSIHDGMPAQILSPALRFPIGYGSYRVKTSAGTEETWNNAEFFLAEED